MRHIKVIPALLSEVPEIRDIVDELPKSTAYPWRVRSHSEIDTIVIHHMASEAPLINQAKFHINGRGWSALGYHIVISDGMILQTNNLLHRTTHCAGYNDRSIGISVRGDLSKRVLTDQERKLLYASIVTVKALFPNAVVKAHNECSKTSCPCTPIDRIRSEVMTLEQELEQLESVPKKEEIAYRMANHVLYLQNMSRGKKSDGSPATPDQSNWAIGQLLKLEPEFRRLGFLK